MLVLQYQDSSILLFFTPTYPTALLSGLNIVALFNRSQFYAKGLLELFFFNWD